jgi:hypothetical protein
MKAWLFLALGAAGTFGFTRFQQGGRNAFRHREGGDPRRESTSSFW